MIFSLLDNAFQEMPYDIRTIFLRVYYFQKGSIEQAGFFTGAIINKYYCMRSKIY